jgi:hypothetical protein
VIRKLALAAALVGALAALTVALVGGSASAGKGQRPVLAAAADGDLKPIKFKVTGKDGKKIDKTLPFFSDGLLAAVRSAGENERNKPHHARPDAGPSADLGQSDIGQGEGTLGCSKRRQDSAHGNVRVNQDCTYRLQAEPDIVFNPTRPTNLLAGNNDLRAGFNQCNFAWSTNNGKHWGDGIPPFRAKLNAPEAQVGPVPGDPNSHTTTGTPGDLHTYDAASDPTVSFDANGRGYFSCVAFDFASNADMVFVAASPAAAQGSFFFNIDPFDRRFVVDEENDPAALPDKPWVVADSISNGPNRNNVYVTWTQFKAAVECNPDPLSGQPAICRSPIYGSMSTNGGETFSTPEEISGISPTLCANQNPFDPNATANSCSLDQGSQPVVLPDGRVVVVFINGNTPDANAQQLDVVCSPSGDSTLGTADMNCGPPNKVGTDVATGEPICEFPSGPDLCVPGPYVRMNDFPRAAVNTDNGHLYVTWNDYRNGEWDIQLAASADGVVWSPTVTVNPDTGLDHFFPAPDVSETGKSDRVGISYYRAQRIPGENAAPANGFDFQQGVDQGVGQGNMDYVLAGGRDLNVPYDFKVVSPVFPPPDGVQTGFIGDYSGLTIPKGDDAHPIWADTRNANPFPENGASHDEDVFTDSIGLPDGKGKPGAGQLGRR